MQQLHINYICTCLVSQDIRNTRDLNANFDKLIHQISQNPDIFPQKYSVQQCFALLKQSIKVYSEINPNVEKINCSRQFIPLLQKARNQPQDIHAAPIKAHKDLSRVTRGYDRISVIAAKREQLNLALLAMFKENGFLVCNEIILGEGDTGTNLYLEKYGSHHHSAKKLLAQKIVPPVLIISNGIGSWGHDYTLAQPQNILERTHTTANPFDFMSSDYYWTNPYVNGRHILQANQVSLSEVQTPILHATVQQIHKKTEHAEDWLVDSCDYRLIMETQEGIQVIYSDKINICTGLGQARVSVPFGLEKSDFERLNQFDLNKQIVPIIDGNQFILTDIEEKAPSKNIVIYGGGGTAAACYRKGFFGHDVRTASSAFSELHRKNEVLWFARQFDKVGTGKLATSAVHNAKERNELFQGELNKVEEQANGMLKLTFLMLDGEEKDQTREVICDQLIYSIGQDDQSMRAVCDEINAELATQFDSHGMLLNVSTPDGKVVFFGAAAMAIREKEYINETMSWLKTQNIGGDVGPGSMPPSRAQMKRYLFLQGIVPKSVNVNMDSSDLILEYLINAGAPHDSAFSFVASALDMRKQSTSGGTRSMLEALLERHQLGQLVNIYGHGLLVSNSDEVQAEIPRIADSRVPLFFPRHKKASTLLLSSVETFQEAPLLTETLSLELKVEGSF